MLQSFDAGSADAGTFEEMRTSAGSHMRLSNTSFGSDFFRSDICSPGASVVIGLII